MFYVPLWYLSSFLLFSCCNFQVKRREAAKRAKRKRPRNQNFLLLQPPKKKISPLFRSSVGPRIVRTSKSGAMESPRPCATFLFFFEVISLKLTELEFTAHTIRFSYKRRWMDDQMLTSKMIKC